MVNLALGLLAARLSLQQFEAASEQPKAQWIRRWFEDSHFKATTLITCSGSSKLRRESWSEHG